MTDFVIPFRVTQLALRPISRRKNCHRVTSTTNFPFDSDYTLYKICNFTGHTVGELSQQAFGKASSIYFKHRALTTSFSVSLKKTSVKLYKDKLAESGIVLLINTQ